MSDSLGDLSKDLRELEASLEQVAQTFLSKASARVAGRAIKKYMNDTGGSAGRRDPGDNGPLRIVSGRLARSLATRSRDVDEGGQPEGIMHVEVAGAIVKLIKGSKVPYAAVHEHGFRGTQRVPSHTRRVRGRDVTVRAHTRNMAIAKRAYLSPALQDRLPQLQKMAEEDLFAFMLKALRV